jgi:hypothetical protein
MRWEAAETSPHSDAPALRWQEFGERLFALDSGEQGAETESLAGLMRQFSREIAPASPGSSDAR